MTRVYAIKNPLFLADTFVFKKHPKYVSVYIKLSGGKIEEIGTDIVARMHYNCPTDEIIERSQEPSEIQKTLLEHISDEYFAHIVRNKNIIKMKEIDKFETALESLIEQFSDVPYEDIADALEFYATRFRKKAEQDESETD